MWRENGEGWGKTAWRWVEAGEDGAAEGNSYTFQGPQREEGMVTIPTCPQLQQRGAAGDRRSHARRLLAITCCQAQLRAGPAHMI